LIAPPLYVITSTCLDRKDGLGALERVIEQIKLGIEQYHGIFKVKMAPKVVTDIDEHALATLMEQAEQENKEVSGDETEEEEGEEGIWSSFFIFVLDKLFKRFLIFFFSLFRRHCW